ncbi:MAG TPA: molybdopterin cofactor-binding domain-containing protein, partial [Actinomycetota bacterium]|nr:molybdopterin cofactor-binding domain-containing protein [Actinomycetota bacterium]
WEDRRQIASFLGWPEERVRVTQVANGGAFGAKEDLNVQCHAALGAVATGRPVLLTLSRAESLRFHPKRHPLTMTYTVGCDAEGRLTGVRARIVGDTGAYASVGDKVLERAAGHACGPYRFDAVDVEATAVYTNNPPCGAMRGFGVNQVAFAIDGMLDRLAERVGIDTWEIRWRNALEVGDRFGTGQVLGEGVGIKACLEAVRDAYRGARYAGIGCGVKNTGIGNGLTEYGRAILRPEADGTITLFHSWTEMGQGVNTALLQIVCEELGTSADRVRVVVDTMRELDTGQTTASRSTVLGGRAIQEAAAKLRSELDGGELRDLAGREFFGEVVIDWTSKPDEDVPNPVTHFAYGWAVQVVLLDGEGRVEKVIAAHDVGKAINPTLLEGQIEGAVHMGLGFGLTEDYVVEGGVPTTLTLKSLGIVPAQRMPEVECIFVEVPQPEGPYGAKGVGEIGLVPTAAACAGALRAFDGRWRTRLPMRDSAAALHAFPKLAAAGRQG